MSYTVYVYVANDDDADSMPLVAEWKVMTIEGVVRDGAMYAGESVVDALRVLGYNPERIGNDDE